MFFSGKLCGIQDFEGEESGGTLHFVKAGLITLLNSEKHQIRLSQNSIIFIPGGMKHHLKVESNEDAELVCASIQIPTHQRTLLTDQLPKFICVSAEDDLSLSETARHIFDEAFDVQYGRQPIINRLCEILIIQLIRHVIKNGFVDAGAFAANANPKLSPLMQAMQEFPARGWSVEGMAEYVAMSRSKFSHLFKETVGLPPMEYLTELRLSYAKTLLLNNKPVNLVALEVGYETASSLAKVFKKRFGITPKKWITNQAEPADQ